jgi:hypothetical protein
MKNEELVPKEETTISEIQSFDEPDPRESIPGYVDLCDLFSMPSHQETWIASHLVSEGRLVSLVGPAKSGKSLLALNCAAAIASGRDFLGVPTKQCTVLYIDQENSAQADVKPRLEQMGYQWTDLEEHFILSSLGKFDDFDTKQGANALIALLQKNDVKVVFIDTIARVVIGKENDNDTYNDLYRYLECQIKSLGISLIRLDHTGKEVDKGARGASAKQGDVDMTVVLSRPSYSKMRLKIEGSRMPTNWTQTVLTIVEKPYLTFVAQDKIEETVEERIKRLVKLLDDNHVPQNLTNAETRIELEKLNESGSNALFLKVTKARKETPLKKPKPR